ncbi:MAG TPA: hypothetical protein VND99_05325 [Candidatus Acidoferrales bacterium]|nr:hypothetical protein [Candidatus Acidoferrales bacterium]
MKPSEHGESSGGGLPQGERPSVIRRKILGEFTSEGRTVPVLRTTPVRRSVNVRSTPGGSLTPTAPQLRPRGADQTLITRDDTVGSRRRDGALAKRPRQTLSLTPRERVLARHPGLLRTSTDKLIRAGEALANIDQQVFRTMLANPYSPHARQAFTAYSPRHEYTPAIARAVILAEPAGERDRHIRQLSRGDRLRVKRDEIDASADIVYKLTRFIASRSVGKHEFGDLSPAEIAAKRQDAFWQLPPEDMYQRLIHVAFGTSEQDEIEQRYSRELRRGVKLGISNFIEGQAIVTSYVNQFNPDVRDGIAQAIFQRSFAMPVYGEATPYGLMFYLSDRDYKATLNKESSGSVISLQSRPELDDRIGVVNRGANGFDPFWLRDLRAHEERHMLFSHAFQGRESLVAAKEVVKRVGEIQAQAASGERGQKLDLRGHRQHARELLEQFTDRAKNEALAYLFGHGVKSEYYRHPITHLGGKYFLGDLTAIKDYLQEVDAVVMSPEDKAAVYGVYKDAFAKYLGQVRVYQWLAANLRRQETNWLTAKLNGEPVVGEEITEGKAEALLQVVPFEQSRWLGRYIGIEPSGITQAFQEEQAQLVADFANQIDASISYFTLYEIVRMYPKEALPALLQVISGTPDGALFRFKDVLSSINTTELILYMHHSTMTQEELLAIRSALGAVATRSTMFHFQDEDFKAARKKAEILSERIIEEYVMGDAFGFAVAQAMKTPEGQEPTIGQIKQLVSLLEGKGSFAWAHYFQHNYYAQLGQHPEGIPVLISIANTATSTAFISSAIHTIAKQYDLLTPELKAQTTVMLFDVLGTISSDSSGAHSGMRAMIHDLLGKLKNDS